MAVFGTPSPLLVANTRTVRSPAAWGTHPPPSGCRATAPGGYGHRQHPTVLSGPGWSCARPQQGGRGRTGGALASPLPQEGRRRRGEQGLLSRRGRHAAQGLPGAAPRMRRGGSAEGRG